MRILHTADWHIGKIVNGFSMLTDQAYILRQIIEIIQQEKPDIVVIAGDLYDRSIPPVGAVKLLNDTLREIVKDNQTPVIAIAGNHDSNERLQFASDLLKDSGLFLMGVLQDPIEKVVCRDAYGAVHFYPIPYMDPPVVAEIYADESIRTHEAAMQRIMQEIERNMDIGVRNIAIAHGYFSMMKADTDEALENVGLQTSDSEKRLSIGGSDLVHGKYFEPFCYTALGHLHGHQQVGSIRMKYSGSPLKYSFSEVNHKKGVILIDLTAEGKIEERFISLQPMRDFRVVRGYLKEIMEQAGEQQIEDYIRAELLDTSELIGAMGKLQSVYPNAMELIRVEKEQALRRSDKQLQIEGKKPEDLYRSFYLQVTGEEAECSQLQWLEKTVNDLQREAREE